MWLGGGVGIGGGGLTWLVLTIVQDHSTVHIIAWVIMFGVVLVIDYGELVGVKQVSCRSLLVLKYTIIAGK